MSLQEKGDQGFGLDRARLKSSTLKGFMGEVEICGGIDASAR